VNILALAFVAGTMLVARTPVLLSIEACLILVPLFCFGLRTCLSPLCALLLGMAWCYCALEVESRHRQALSDSGEQVLLAGRVTGMPVENERSVRFLLRVTEGEFKGAQVRLYWYHPEVIPRPGERWRFQVRLRAPTGSVNFDAFDYERWLFTKRIHATGYVLPDARHQVTGVDYTADRLRHEVARSIRAVVPEDALPTFLALALGDTSQLKPDNWSILNATGTTHLLIVSGLHVGLMATLSFVVCRFVGVGYTAASLVTILVAAAYALLAGWGLPVQRALVMTVVYLACGLLSRNISLLSRLTLAALFVVMLDPLASLSTGFWLSFGVVGALILALSNRLSNSNGGERSRVIWESQWVAFIALLPLLGLLNHQLPLMSLPVNMVAIPVVGFVLVPLILLSLVMTFLPGPLGDWLIELTNLVTHVVWYLLKFAAETAGVLHIASPEPWRVVFAISGVIILLLPRGMVPRWLGVPMLLLLLDKSLPLEPGVLRVTFLDVGQGLSVLLESGSGTTLYDTGPSFEGSFSAAGQVVLPAIRGRGWQGLDQMILSHGDNDHSGGRQEIIDTIHVGRVIEQGACEASWERDGIWFTTFGVSESGSRNDDSCVLLVVVGGRRLLLTGDIEARGEAALLSRFAMPVDVISVPHHGSESSSTPAFLNQLLPTMAIVSAGYRNRFGHPDARIVRRYENRSLELLSTIDSGAIEIILRAEGMMIRGARHQASGIWRRHGSHRQAGRH